MDTSLIKPLEAFILDPANHDFLSVFKAGRNGLVYGAKIRFPHAVVTTFLFGRGTFQQRLHAIYWATRQHAIQLGTFAVLYKAATKLMRQFNGGKSQSFDSFVAGCIGGWFIYRDRTAINEQMFLYCVARCVSSLLPRATVTETYPATRPIPMDKKTFEVAGTLVWGCTMWLFAEHRRHLQSGMVSSMDYVYNNAERWNGLRNLVWHNT